MLAGTGGPSFAAGRCPSDEFEGKRRYMRQFVFTPPYDTVYIYIPAPEFAFPTGFLLTILAAFSIDCFLHGFYSRFILPFSHGTPYRFPRCLFLFCNLPVVFYTVPCVVLLSTASAYLSVDCFAQLLQLLYSAAFARYSLSLSPLPFFIYCCFPSVFYIVFCIGSSINWSYIPFY